MFKEMEYVYIHTQHLVKRLISNGLNRGHCRAGDRIMGSSLIWPLFSRDFWHITLQSLDLSQLNGDNNTSMIVCGKMYKCALGTDVWNVTSMIVPLVLYLLQPSSLHTDSSSCSLLSQPPLSRGWAVGQVLHLLAHVTHCLLVSEIQQILGT